MLAAQRVVKSLFTSKDNESQDIIKWLATLGFMVAIFLTVWEVMYAKKAFDIILYNTALSGMLVAVAGALRIKLPTDPDSTNSPTTLISDEPVVPGTTTEQATTITSKTTEKTTITS